MLMILGSNRVKSVYTLNHPSDGIELCVLLLYYTDIRIRTVTAPSEPTLSQPTGKAEEMQISFSLDSGLSVVETLFLSKSDTDLQFALIEM